MPELLPAPPALVTTQAPRPGVSPQQVALPYRELSDTLKTAGEAAEGFAETQATRAGYGAASMNPDGTVQIQKAPIIGPASQYYERAAKYAALAEGEGIAKDKAREYMTQFADNPQGYLPAMEGFKQKTIQQYSDAGIPDVGLELARAIDSSTTFTYRMLINRKQSLDLKEDWQNIQDGRTSAANDLHALARGGDTSSTQFQQAWSKYAELTKEAVNNVALGYSGAKAQFDTDQLHGELQGDAFLHHVDQVYQDQSVGPDGVPRGGPRAALAYAQSILTNPNIPLSPAQRQQYQAKAVSEVRANEAMRHQDIADARAAEQAVDETSYLGARVDPQQVDQVGAAYIAAGDPASAARFYAKMTRKPLNDDFGRQPLTDQLSQLGTLQNGANPSTPAEAALINHESGGNPQRVNQLGYAGLYQFGAPLLTDLGLYKPGVNENLANWSSSPANAAGKWSGTFDIPGFPQVKTLRDFLANPGAQKAAFDAHTANMDAQIKANGLDRYIGQTVAGVPITREGLHAMIHLGGVDGTRVALQTNGTVNPRDANGTSLLDYARLGAESAHGTPSANMWLAANRARTIDTEARQTWKSLSADYDKTGVRPANATLSQLVEAARLSGDSGLLDTIADGVGRMDTVQRIAQEPLPEQAAALGTLRQAGAAGLLQPDQAAVLKDLQRKTDAITKGLATNPIATTVQNFSHRFTMPGPLDFNAPQALAANLAQRAKIAQFAGQNWQNGTPAALDAADLAQVKGTLANAKPEQKAQIFAGLATLPRDVLGATLRKLGGNNAGTMADAAAGSLMREAPAIATSIFRGQAQIKADKKFDPESQATGTKEGEFRSDLQTMLPPAMFTDNDRADPTGPYATMTAMISARYADLAAQTGDHNYSAKRVQQAVDDVTGGVLHFNGAPLIAPVRGMQQGQFDATIAGLGDKDLDGVTTLQGEPVTADYVRDNAHLQGVGDGRYYVTLGHNPAKPIYAYLGANTEAPTKFVLDLRNRPAPSNFAAGVPFGMMPGTVSVGP